MRSDVADLKLSEHYDLYLDEGSGDLALAGRGTAQVQIITSAVKTPRGQWIYDWLFGNEIWKQVRSLIDTDPSKFKAAVVDCLSRPALAGVVRPLSWSFEFLPGQEPRVFVTTASGENVEVM